MSSDNPYADTHNPVGPPAKKTPWGMIIGGVLGATLLLSLCCCGGCFYVVNKGIGMQADMVKAEFSTHPKVKEHLGELQTVTTNFTKTGELGENEVIVFDASGSKGDGELIVKPNNNQPGEYSMARLRLPNGDEIDLKK